MGSVSSEWIEAIQARLEARFPDREVRSHGQVGPMGPLVFTTKYPDGYEECIGLAWERFEDYQTIEKILPQGILDIFEREGSLTLNSDNTSTLGDPRG
jgi:hypothetical protein